MATEFFALESETLWPPSLLLWNPKNVMAIDSNCPSLKNVMATESFALAPEKRYGHRLKLLRNPKNDLATN